LINQYFHVTLTVIVGFFVYTAIIFGIRAVTSDDFAMVKKQI
jgi:hypothetical protein